MDKNRAIRNMDASKDQDKTEKANGKKRSPINYKLNEKNGKKELACNIDALPDQTLDAEKIFHHHVMNLTGTEDTEIALEIISSGVNAMPYTKGMDCNSNVIVQSLSNFKAQNPTEARLCTQATVLYTRGMRYMAMAENKLEQMKDADMFEQSGLVEAHQAQMKLGMKLLRLHNETIDALSRLRRGNEQRFTVQHQYVQVNDGGKAIVGQAGGGIESKNEEPHGL
jgi:hypothetical protein